MPWQGNASVMIDRFDVRAHLDYIPEVHQNKTPEGDLSYEERQINYERYRILVQNEFFGSEYFSVISIASPSPSCVIYLPLECFQ